MSAEFARLKHRAKLNNDELITLGNYCMDSVNLKTVQSWQKEGVQVPKIIIDNLKMYIELSEGRK